MPSVRLQKLLARAGHGSRRSAERLISAGRVTVDGRLAALGERADPERQRIELDGEPLAAPAATLTLMLHKPAGVIVSAADERGRRTVYDLLPEAPTALRYVGRLDRDSAGLLLLTTDGELAHRVAHPRFAVPKVYEAVVDGSPDGEALERLRAGVPLDDGITAPAGVEVLAAGPPARVRITIHEGRKRQVRRMLAAVGHRVRELIRVQLGDLRLGDLAAGQSRKLTAAEEHRLRALVALPPLPPDAPSAATSPVDAAAAPPLSSPAPRLAEDAALPDSTAPDPAAADPATPAAQTDEPSLVESLARSVAVDGPAASGKSVVSRTLAERLGYGFFDTGLMYRACTLAVLDAGLDPEDEQAVINLVRGLDLRVAWPEPAAPRIEIDGSDVTAALRAPEVERAVSLVSRISAVREELVRRQRALAAQQPIVMAGRDIGTRVLVEARTKVFLDASIEVRARRRLGEELDGGRDSTFERVVQETRRRDELDATGKRAVRPEQAAEDAVIIDTDLYGIEEVVQLCLDAYRRFGSVAAE